MSQCNYIYISGLRVKSGDATITLNDQQLKLVRGGNGKPAPGSISIKQLRAALEEQGSSTIEATVTVKSGASEASFKAPVDPSRAVGRRGRECDAVATLAKMDPADARLAAAHQISTLPYSLKAGRNEAERRLAAMMPLLDSDGLRSAAQADSFWKLADLEGLDWLVAENTATALAQAADRLSEAQIAQAVADQPQLAVRHARHRLSDTQKLQALIQDPELARYLKDEIRNPTADQLVEQLRQLRRAAEEAEAGLVREWDTRSITEAELEQQRAALQDERRRQFDASTARQAALEARLAAATQNSSPE
jgi:hypothetical protein